MSDNTKKFYLTTPIYYVNARPHIGHAYTTIAADVIARRQRLLLGAENVWFLTGTDEHGQKIERSAAAAGIPPQQFADQVSAQFESLWKRMGITNNQYIRTTDPDHVRGVQKLFNQLYERGHIYLDSYTGQYSVGEEMFIDGPPGTIGPDGKPTETVTEENFYFRLSAFQSELIDRIEADPDDPKAFRIEPEARRNEVLSFLRGNIPSTVILSEAKNPRILPDEPQTSPESTIAYSVKGTPYLPGALKDISISRSSFDWGIPVPEPAASTTQKKHVIYVWLDALANYMTAVGYGSDKPEDQAKLAKFWPADLHLVGKEIIRFHCVYWPAFLLAADLPLPKKVQAHGWLLFEESKMSKSRGNIVRTETILDAFGTLCPPVPGSPVDPTQNTATNTVPNTPINTVQNTVINATKNTVTDVTKNTVTDAAQNTAINAVQNTVTNAAQNAVILSGASQSHREAESKDPEGLNTTTTARTFPPQISTAPIPAKAGQDLFAADVLRYFLLREIPFGQDGSFSFDALVQRYNSDLANGYGNLVSRTLAMIAKYCDGTIPEYLDEATVDHLADSVYSFNGRTAWKEYFKKYIWVPFGEAVTDCNFSRAIDLLWNGIRIADGYITAQAPWKLGALSDDASRINLKAILYATAESLRIITSLLFPILPYTTAKVWAQLGLGNIEEAARNGELKNLEWGGLKPGTKLGPLSPIFPRAPKELIQIMTDMENPVPPTPSKLVDEKTTHTSPVPADSTHPGAAPRTSSLPEENPGATVAGSAALSTERPGTPPHHEAQASGVFAAAATTTPDTAQIAIDDFVKIDLRVAKIIVAERIPKADKLLRLEVDLGYEKRQILSGIAEWYTPEELLGRRIVIIANLAPRKMRGLESHGMLLAASNGENSKPILATFAEDIELGSRLK